MDQVSLALIITSILSGMLSVLAPCAISVIPILLSRSSSRDSRNIKSKIKPHSPFWILLGLATSIFVFSLLLKASTLLINIPTQFWQIISGVIIILFGVSSIWPSFWEKIAGRLKLQNLSARLSKAGFSGEPSVKGDILIGASLGPVFSSCSPTYALIIATILPASFSLGILYLLAFIAGFIGMLILISLGGQKLIQKLGWSLKPNSLFRKTLGIILIMIGLGIMTGVDKQILSYFVQNGLFDWQVNLENNLVF